MFAPALIAAQTSSLGVLLALEPAAIGTLLVGVGALIGGLASIVLRKDDRRLSELQMAWTINQDIQAEKDKRLDELNKTIDDLRTRATLSDQKYTEMERRFHDCQQSNQAMQATLEFMRTFMPNVPFPTKKPPFRSESEQDDL